jgi:DMSO/TMAO reductase YedYZ molybdopterin-dependent catalytic subunit
METEPRERQAGEHPEEAPRPVVVKPAPYNAETPPEALRAPLTPNASFFVRCNHPVPRLGEHRLTVGGEVEVPLALDMRALEGLPRRTVRATLECAGNGRTGMAPLPPGEPWGQGAVGTAEWTGVPLAEVLGRARPRPEVVEVVAWGAGGEGARRFARALPLRKALDPDTLLALGMNGEPLPVEHGGPVRLLVPGWYGMASVKWVARLEGWTRPFEGYYQRERYVYDAGDGWEEPVTRMRVRARILSPAEGERVAPGRVLVEGVAWSGERRVVRVEVAVDGGDTWEPATLLEEPRESVWVRWAYTWEATEPGRHLLRTRATDEAGEVQPELPEWNRLGYGNNAVRPVRVEVG